MSELSTIRSYLIGLGFKVDDISRRKWEDTLKLTAVKTEKIAANMALGITAAGGAMVTALAAVTGATVGLASSVAKNDLNYQLFARRMFMGTEAAKKMKIATDALGYSLEEIIWGPPELAERYHQLIKDQTAMLKYLGSDGGEKAFRKIRDIQFEFTRMEPALKIFGMKLTEDVINKLFGGSESLEQRLKEFNAWFQTSIPEISDRLSNGLVPALKAVGDLASKIFTKKNVDWVINVVTKGADTASKDMEFLGSNNKLGLIWDKDKGFNENINDLLGISGLQPLKPTSKNAPDWFHQQSDPSVAHDYDREIISDALKLGIPPGLALAIADKESGINPYAPKGSHGEIGMFQLMPDTIKSLMQQGLVTDPNNPDQNIWGGLNWLKEKKGSGSWDDAAKRYNGSGPAADEYQKDVLRRWHHDYGYLDSPDLKPMSYSPTINVGGVHIANTAATPEQIANAVEQGITKANRKAATRMFATVQGSFA